MKLLPRKMRGQQCESFRTVTYLLYKKARIDIAERIWRKTHTMFLKIITVEIVLIAHLKSNG
jgi:hypothetical protein